jgi:hypothetical protein
VKIILPIFRIDGESFLKYIDIPDF